MEGDFYRWTVWIGQTRLEKDNGEDEKDDEEDERDSEEYAEYEQESVEYRCPANTPESSYLQVGSFQLKAWIRSKLNFRFLTDEVSLAIDDAICCIFIGTILSVFVFK